MAIIPPHFLSKKGGRWRSVKVLDLAIMLLHVHKGAQDDAIGFADARESLESLTKRLNKRIFVDPALLESAAWSCNMAYEQGKWWHPKDMDFKEWVKRVFGKSDFDLTYNMIKEKD